ncbi:TetR/AcrR family transcriptional regulator [Microbacterium marinilacus]|uniref:TetR/AcrR family transcriptional regulator n=1 Tax=Microbacterium marinilacus TaxID=415209 RepID=A0ABP7B5H0_9MICO|nr:TetR/AcrR family transcriptional regulator [Microbacterium marinilacus]MBY0689940.1 TetR/AcrR family transcriptional regulator [Microbacterium marinilacus]
MTTDDEAARARLVAAADRLFYAHGIQSVGMDAVRAEAGVSLKRIYGLFPSKDDLVVAVLAHRTEIWNEGVTRAAAAEASPEGKLLSVFDFLSDWFREDDFRGCAFINSFGELGARSPKVASAIRAQKAAFRAHVLGLVREHGATDDVAVQIALLAEGAQTTAAILRDPTVAGQARSAAETLLAHAGAR